MRLGSREVPRVRSVIYVSPSPKRDAPSTTIQPTFNPFCRPSTYPSILITTSDSLVDWIRDLLVHLVCLFDFQTLSHSSTIATARLLRSFYRFFFIVALFIKNDLERDEYPALDDCLTFSLGTVKHQAITMA